MIWLPLPLVVCSNVLLVAFSDRKHAEAEPWDGGPARRALQGAQTRLLFFLLLVDRPPQLSLQEGDSGGEEGVLHHHPCAHLEDELQVAGFLDGAGSRVAEVPASGGRQAGEARPDLGEEAGGHIVGDERTPFVSG